jgi:VIT1/CCC1 family predicted Fe2+/Mn2+ transporter
MAKKIRQGHSHQLVTGISFGLTSGVITALGMIVGLYSATYSRLAVVAGTITMAIADGLADGAGQHMSEEAEIEQGKAKHTQREIWLTTLFTFLSVCGSILSFIPFFLIFPLKTAIFVGLGWGILLLVVFNYLMAKARKENAFIVIVEHVALAVFVIVVSYFVGILIGMLVG